MSGELSEGPKRSVQVNQKQFQQFVLGSRKVSNFIVGIMVSIGGLGFLLASLSSYFGRDFLPLGHPASMIFVPQGLLMGLYGIAAVLLASYLWTLIAIDFGSGSNFFDKDSGTLSVSRRAFLKQITIKLPLKDIKAVKIESRDGINPIRRISLRFQNRTDLPLSSVGDLIPLSVLEEEGAQLARFLDVNLEGIS